jgi:amino acid permease
LTAVSAYLPSVKMDYPTDAKDLHVSDPVIVSEVSEQQGDYERRLSTNEWAKYRHTKRGLAPRHVQLMAIGG